MLGQKLSFSGTLGYVPSTAMPRTLFAIMGGGSWVMAGFDRGAGYLVNCYGGGDAHTVDLVVGGGQVSVVNGAGMVQGHRAALAVWFT